MAQRKNRIKDYHAEQKSRAGSANFLPGTLNSKLQQKTLKTKVFKVFGAAGRI
ncbi:MAG: hypothetical protein SOR61_00835 [Evtepia sp.]|nr:hypothetical protein [Evtepia sp.]